MRNDDAERLDRIIDGALAEYSDGEPLAGMEERVLNRVRVEGAGRGFTRGWWAIALAAAMAALVVAGRRPAEPKLVAHTPQTAGRPLAERPEIVAPARPEVKAGRRKMTSRRPEALPKLDTFPAMLPVSKEEQALVELAAEDPGRTLDAFRDLQRRGAAPLAVNEIQIEPLRRDDAK